MHNYSDGYRFHLNPPQKDTAFRRERENFFAGILFLTEIWKIPLLIYSKVKADINVHRQIAAREANCWSAPLLEQDRARLLYSVPIRFGALTTGNERWLCAQFGDIKERDGCPAITSIPELSSCGFLK